MRLTHGTVAVIGLFVFVSSAACLPPAEEDDEETFSQTELVLMQIEENVSTGLRIGELTHIGNLTVAEREFLVYRMLADSQKAGGTFAVCHRTTLIFNKDMKLVELKMSQPWFGAVPLKCQGDTILFDYPVVLGSGDDNAIGKAVRFKFQDGQLAPSIATR